MTELFNGDIVGRKAHKCDLCGLAIAAGTKHRLAKVKDGGEFASFRYHPHCDRVAVIDKWDDIDWEGSGGDHELFRERLAELVEQGKIVMPEPRGKAHSQAALGHGTQGKDTAEQSATAQPWHPSKALPDEPAVAPGERHTAEPQSRLNRGARIGSD